MARASLNIGSVEREQSLDAATARLRAGEELYAVILGEADTLMCQHAAVTELLFAVVTVAGGLGPLRT